MTFPTVRMPIGSFCLVNGVVCFLKKRDDRKDKINANLEFICFFILFVKAVDVYAKQMVPGLGSQQNALVCECKKNCLIYFAKTN